MIKANTSARALSIMRKGHVKANYQAEELRMID